jgi:uncharacterized protein YpiB (UPF0302 family)
MKKHLLNAPQQPGVMDSLFAEMLLDKALCDFRKKQIKKEIDRSLEEGNKEAFLRLSEEYKSIL